MRPSTRLPAVACFAAFAATAAPNAIEILERRCAGCHGASAKMSGLDASTREGLLRGGTKGPAVAPGDSANSVLFWRVRDGQMPPSAKLPSEEVEALQTWIDAGAQWTGGAIASKRAGPDWWSLQPISVTSAPDAPAAWASSPIDRWIWSKLREKGLSPAPPADRRTLIRRLTFDLIGMPPTPEEVSAFVNDKSADAYERLVERLLASPHYGERWARHWLDVARFAESEGFERDWMREHAWPYRDWAIRAFNSDKPYTEFAREQIAGDVFENGTRDGIVATGLLVSGPTDEVGLTSAVPEQRDMVREDQLEEMVGTVSQAFLGLTVNCARCHDHKFDPIPQRDYYAFKANFAGVWQGERPLLTDAEQRRREFEMKPVRNRIARLETRIAAREAEARAKILATRGVRPAAIPAPIAHWTFDTDTRDRVGGLHFALPENAVLEKGRVKPTKKDATVTLETAPIPRDVREKTLEAWVTVTQTPVKSLAVFGIANQAGFRGAAADTIQSAGKHWENASTARFRSQDAKGPEEDTAAGGRIHIAIAYAADDTIHIYRNGVPYGEPYKPDVTTPAGRLQKYDRGDAVVRVASSATLEIDEARLYDVALTPEQIAASFAAGAASLSREELEAAMDSAARDRIRASRKRLEAARRKLKSFSKPEKIFAVDSKAPGVGHVLERGDPAKKKDVVSPAGLSAIRGLDPSFGLKPDASDAERRRKLADWIASPANPLFARVMANRVWHHHFGGGIASSPSDFGYNGGQPSHPELLDWLASEFAANGWSVKKLHKTIAMSAAYRQSARYDAKAAAIDAENRLLWRFPARRLEGEAVRDAMLAVSGQLNPRMGGPSVRAFTSEKKGSLEIYTLIDKADPEFDRRTVYRMNINSAPNPMLEGLDCPLPSVKTPKRATTTTPLQALSLMNNAFVSRQAKAFAARVEREAATAESRIERAFELALGRAPDREERAWSADLAGKGGVEALCWGLFNTSEFVYVD